MIKILKLVLLSSIVLLAEQMPKDAIKNGTLANQKLIYDTKFAVAAKMATLGCDKPETLQMFIRQMPTGKVGSRIWRETWVIGGCDKKYPIKVDFIETKDGAVYSIKP